MHELTWAHVGVLIAAGTFVMWLFSRARIRRIDGETPLTVEAIEERLKFQRIHNPKNEPDIVKAIASVIEEVKTVRDRRQR